MRQMLPNLLLAAAASTALAAFTVLFYNNWYFAGDYWPKWLLLAVALTPAYTLLLYSAGRPLWFWLGWYWTVLVGGFMLAGWNYDLSKLTFTGELNLEVPMVWLPVAGIAVYGWVQARRRAQVLAAERQGVDRALNLRQRLRRNQRPRPALAVLAAPGAQLPAIEFTEEEAMLIHEAAARPVPPEPPATQSDDESRHLTVLSLLLTLGLCVLALLVPGSVRAEGVDSTEPWHRPDRHEEFKDPSLRWHPDTPELSAAYPAPLVSRAGETFEIRLENKPGGEIRVQGQQADGTPIPDQLIGHVLSPATQVSKEGFTASGWAVPGTVCATAVNAMHIKTNHDYSSGRSWVFSILPKEFANFDASHYNSFYSASGAIVTDLPAGSGIFGGLWAPVVGNEVSYARPSAATATATAPGGLGDFTPLQPLPTDYTPTPGDQLLIHVVRKTYNPEYIEFENRFGGIVWVKELGLEPYPIAQVLKPVAGSGRFGGSEYAERGRIRANHPGVICVSTSDKGEIGGFQIIPRDHSMSPEMTNARTKTQWMVIGPLWAFDESWEGLPPLFTDYIYPAFIPTSGKLPDGEQVDGAKVFLSRCTVRARYSDSPTPDEYEKLRETRPLSFECLATMTNLRIYFARE